MLLRDLMHYLWWRIASRHDHTRGVAESGGASIHYQMIGKGPVVVFLHGGLSSSLDWYLILPKMSLHFTVVLIDFRGHGRSTLDEQQLSYELYGRDVIAVLDALAIKQFGVVGWSDGGNVGLWLAYQHPERITRLVAISANTRFKGLTDKAKEMIAQIQSSSSPWLPRLLHKLRSNDKDVLWTDVKPMVARLWQVKTILTLEQLKTIRTRTLLIIGSKDDIRQDHAKDIALAIPQSKLVVLPGVTHNVPFNARNQLTTLIIEHMLADRLTD